MKVLAQRENTQMILISLEDGDDRGFMYDLESKYVSPVKDVQAFIKFGYWVAPTTAVSVTELKEIVTGVIGA
jgi:hypothetical protein